MKDPDDNGPTDTTEPLPKVQLLSISDAELEIGQLTHAAEKRNGGTGDAILKNDEFRTKITGPSRRSNSSPRCYRKGSNSFSDEEATQANEDVPGTSRPRSSSVEGKRPADRGDNTSTPLPKYRKEQSANDEDNEVVSSQPDSPPFGDIPSPQQRNNQRNDSSSIEDSEVHLTTEEDIMDSSDSDHDRVSLVSSSTDSDESAQMFYEETSSSPSSVGSLPDLVDQPADAGPGNGGNAGNQAGSNTVLPELLPEQLTKPKPKESWFGPRAIVGREISAGKYAGRKEPQAEQHFRGGFYGSLFSAERLELMTKLEGHSGCVNCLSFNFSGTKLASGSDDLDIKIWNYTLGKCITSFHSGHRANVFQAKFVPFLGSDTMIVSSARDNQIRLNELGSSGEVVSSRKLAQHRGACHKLSIHPENPHVILTAGEDSFVFSIDIREDKPNRILNVREGGKKVSLYSLHQNPFQPSEFCVAGKDSYVRVFDIRKLPSVTSPEWQGSIGTEGNGGTRRTAFPPVKKFCPHHLMRGESDSDTHVKTNVTSAVYNYNGTEILASYNDEHIYLFDASHSDGADFIKKYEGHRNNMTVKGVNFFGDRSQFIVSGSDCGHIFIWERNTESIVNFFKGDDKGVVNCLEGHPTVPILATSGLDDDVKIWVPSHETQPKMPDLLSTIKRNKKKRESSSNIHSVSDGFVMWALRHQMRVVHGGRSVRRQQQFVGGGDDSDLMDDDSDWEDDGPGGMDCVVA